MKHIIQANPGFLAIYENSEDDVQGGEPKYFKSGHVIAWIIDDDKNNGWRINGYTGQGIFEKNCAGVMNPDGTVEMFHIGSFASLDEANDGYNARRNTNEPKV